MTAPPGYEVCHLHGAPRSKSANIEDANHRPPPPMSPFDGHAAMHRVLAIEGETPMAERYITLRSIRVANSDAYVVAVVDGRNVVTDWSSTCLTPDIAKARNAANKLFQRTTKED
jgi:hypothetical protein